MSLVSPDFHSCQQHLSIQSYALQASSCARPLRRMFCFATGVVSGLLFRSFLSNGRTHLDSSLAQTVPRLLTWLLLQPPIDAVSQVGGSLSAWFYACSRGHAGAAILRLN